MAQIGISRNVGEIPRIQVPERGEIELSRDQWNSLSDSRDFWQAVERGIIRLGQISNKTYRIHASCYVGRIHCKDLILELSEKIPGALQSLLRFASCDMFRVEAISGTSSELGQLVTILIDQFLQSLRRYASGGREFQYRQQKFQGSLIGGRVDVTRSIQLRARGLRHLVAFDKNVLSFSTEANQVVLLALREIERLTRAINLPDGILQSARGFAMLFEDCMVPRLLVLRREDAIRAADRSLSTTSNALLRDVLALARVILAHESFEQSTKLDSQVPRAWFINLEGLFERAVRRVLTDLCEDGYVVTKGDAFAPRIFTLSGDEYRARPDLVIRKKDATAVGDVKYKSWSGSADHSDVYQLLVHASAYSSNSCFLVYPGTSFTARRLGRSATGQETWFFEVDVSNLNGDLRHVLSTVCP